MPIHLWVAAGRPQTAVKQCLPAGHRHAPSLNLRYLPFLTQTRYDHLLRHCDLNVVRGEDSLVRAIWAGRPLIWHIYPQADGVHHDKLDAFLALSQAPILYDGGSEEKVVKASRVLAARAADMIEAGEC